MTRTSSKKTTDCWYLNFCALRYICNNRKLFLGIRSKNCEFVTASGDIFQSKKVTIVVLPIQGGKTTMRLLNIAYTPKYDFNLISLGQFRESGILYHNHSNSIIFKKIGSILEIANKYKNVFVLETSLKAILVREKSRPMYFLSPNL